MCKVPEVGACEMCSKTQPMVQCGESREKRVVVVETAEVRKVVL